MSDNREGVVNGGRGVFGCGYALVGSGGRGHYCDKMLKSTYFKNQLVLSE